MLGHRRSGEHTAVILDEAVCGKGFESLLDRGVYEIVVDVNEFLDKRALFPSSYGSLICQIAGPWLTAIVS
jgi:hypothetical protein